MRGVVQISAVLGLIALTGAGCVVPVQLTETQLAQNSRPFIVDATPPFGTVLSQNSDHPNLIVTLDDPDADDVLYARLFTGSSSAALVRYGDFQPAVTDQNNPSLRHAENLPYEFCTNLSAGGANPLFDIYVKVADRPWIGTSELALAPGLTDENHWTFLCQ